MPRTKSSKDIKLVAKEIQEITDVFCGEHLNAEYRDLCRKVIAKIARKKKSPFARGQARVWAAGVVHAVGWVNFLHDKSQDPYMSVDDLCKRFGVSKASVQGNSRQIRKILDVIPMEPEYTLPSMLQGNPLAWMVQIDGFIVDARTLPEHVQEDARRRGLIPNLVP